MKLFAWRWWGVGVLWLLGGSLVAAAPHPQAAVTVVVANADDPESLAIAEAYQAFRGIPEDNIIRLPLPLKRDITRAQFVEMLVNPLRAALFERGLFDGDFIGVPDTLGRRPIILFENKVRYIVLCRGVPLRISEAREADDAAMLEDYLRDFRRASRNPQFDWPQPYRKNQASVDSDLSMLAMNKMPILGLVQNPLMGRLRFDPYPPVMRVARLDGPSNEAVLAALEGVRAVEANGLKGRAYFDLRSIKEGSPYRLGDDWIERASELAGSTHMDLEIDRAGATMSLTQRMDAPALYMGWYAGHVTGPFTLDRFQFAPGAIAMHLHSTSAANPQSTDRHWVGAFVAAGASATVGNVYEPFLTQTHQFQAILGAMMQGTNFGDAAYAAIPCLSWQWAVFGDPLYEPFKVDHAAMLKSAREMKDPALDPYVIMREMNRLVAEGDTTAARDLGREMLEKEAHPALALHLARLERQLNKKITARRRLEPFAEEVRFRPQDWMLFTEIARELDAWEAPDAATALYRHLIDDGRQPRDLKKLLYKEGSAAALWTSAAESEAWKAAYEAILAEEAQERAEAEAKKQAEEAAKAAKAAEAEAAKAGASG